MSGAGTPKSQLCHVILLSMHSFGTYTPTRDLLQPDNNTDRGHLVVMDGCYTAIQVDDGMCGTPTECDATLHSSSWLQITVDNLASNMLITPLLPLLHTLRHANSHTHEHMQ